MACIEAKPTNYNGILFRSRLEATWACFFDLLNWQWRYEPFDLEGWVPDFEIETSIDERLLVEVKPEILKNYNLNKIEYSPYEKVFNHVQEFNILLLGTSLFTYGGYCALGLLIEKKFVLEGQGFRQRCMDSSAKYYNSDIASLKRREHSVWQIEEFQYGLSPLYGDWTDWLNNVPNKSFIEDYEHKDVLFLFNEAITMTRKNYMY